MFKKTWWVKHHMQVTMNTTALQVMITGVKCSTACDNSQILVSIFSNNCYLHFNKHCIYSSDKRILVFRPFLYLFWRTH